MFFQILSRNNDINGNPYRLILVYNSAGVIVEAMEARSSSPNCVHALRERFVQTDNFHMVRMIELPSFHLAPAEYNSVKRQKHINAILKHED